MSTEHIRAEKTMIVELEVSKEEFDALKWGELFINDSESHKNKWRAEKLERIGHQINEKYPVFFDNTNILIQRKNAEMLQLRAIGGSH